MVHLQQQVATICTICNTETQIEMREIGLLYTSLHEGAALVAALLGAREPLHEEVRGAEGAQLPHRAPRLRGYRLLAAPNLFDAVGEVLNFLLKIIHGNFNNLKRYWKCRKLEKDEPDK